MYLTKPLFVFVLALFLAAQGSLFGQETPPAQRPIDWKEDLSLEEFLGLKVAVASAGVELEQREAPGIVTILTAEQLRNLGARDLAEALALIPGFQFSIDTYGYTSLVARGNYTGDGKFLLLIDGIEVNEFGYNSVSLFHHFDLTQIARLEVIRGPGSARYGGAAELAVINIITQTPEELGGIAVTAQTSASQNQLMRNSLGISAGRKWNDRLAGAIHVSGIDAVLTDQVYDSPDGQVASMGTRSPIRTGNVYAHLTAGKWRMALWQDNHRTPLNSTAGVLFSTHYPVIYNSTRAEADYTTRVGEFWELTTGLRYGGSNAYSLLTGPLPADSTYIDFFTQNRVYRGMGFLHGSYTKGKRFSFSGGLEHRTEAARYLNYDGEVFPVYYLNDSTGRNTLLVHWASAFAQGLWQTQAGVFTVGGQMTLHSLYGAAFAPRLAFTRAREHGHVKLLAARGYRAPATFNLVLSATFDPNNPRPLYPETAWTFEFEGGIKAGKSLYLQANAFFIRQQNVILYDAQANDLYAGYSNVGNGGTFGVEADLKLTRPWGEIEATYAFYSAAGLNEILDYEVPGNTGSLLGAAQHTASLRGVVKLGKHVSLSPVLLLYGPRYGIVGYNAVGDTTPGVYEPGEINRNIAGQYPAIAMLNLQVSARDLWKDRLEIALLGQNLLNTRQALIPAYIAPEASFEGPLYLPRAQVTLKVAVRLYQ